MWGYLFIKRYILIFRLPTHIEQNLPLKTNEMINIFLKNIIIKRTKYAFNLNTIGNMDETPKYLNISLKTVVEKNLKYFFMKKYSLEIYEI